MGEPPGGHAQASNHWRGRSCNSWVRGEEATQRQALSFVPDAMLSQRFSSIDACPFDPSGTPAEVCGPVCSSTRSPRVPPRERSRLHRPGDEFGPNAIT
ncbi:hypothetical protein [Burkholderia sp. S-53]|uniref:hypothetical protein n=1 Tax=Burkholderia sp. S-53 TaxID=2906514 RepID=UPI0021D125CF|nr:hypothetical protein [Burkholderia sp. S-53]UXU90602.1 hypothetical protein LXM88_35545 [Burkholderia sp. S-53]